MLWLKEAPMPIDMPEPLTRYLEHDAHRDVDAIVALFTDDANFPGGTADLNWDFTIAGQHITRLVIAP